MKCESYDVLQIYKLHVAARLSVHAEVLHGPVGGIQGKAQAGGGVRYVKDVRDDRNVRDIRDDRDVRDDRDKDKD